MWRRRRSFGGDFLLSLPVWRWRGPRREVVARRFHELRSQDPALNKLAERGGVDQIESLDDVAAGVLRSSGVRELSVQFDREAPVRPLTHGLTVDDSGSDQGPAGGINSVDAWLDRLDEHGMIMGHSSGTSQNSSVSSPHSQADWRGWKAGVHGRPHGWRRGSTPKKRSFRQFSPGYRYGHQLLNQGFGTLLEVHRWW